MDDTAEDDPAEDDPATSEDEPECGYCKLINRLICNLALVIMIDF